ncbi:MAG: 4-hydroxy-tetrahydrodipicolinate synthase [Nitrospinaceae bacterium]|nr:4-hydroxy-tetrahydrodipicolinate synthase [Nitrospinaceae bacterium]NIR54161.1 4-hydroxy-tetrahydrodipicolinate synthase [Nitrospinaceae bacterium]NIS84575.1 4-hydroxy-tetrahydrodipicolinate synthase [Nitrospinaceae bacterium]NIT81367.1 4-hydroxy-tetrahydrodipicolinate synthase [Nitrospinaceae bacterium]NIU43654.1 4-hydroxy-tetrahydrodipicolinate synthase [Nitrospinaceae bacterium]
MFKGSLVAIVTPFKDGRVDEQAFRDLLQFHIENGTHGVVPCGTTGESATLTNEEHHQVISIAVEVCKDKISVLAGTGSNSTREAIEMTQFAQKAGADGALLITPYYNKPTQQGMYEHFMAVAKETDLPIILYNVPGRTSVNMLPDTVARLNADQKNIIGIKEASGSLNQISEVIDQCGEDFVLLSGDDGLLWPILAIGGQGVISVSANLVPEKMALLCDRATHRDMDGASSLHYELLALNEAMFIETSPVPVKTALSLMGKISGEVRPPLAHMSEEHLTQLKAILRQYDLI